MAELSFDGRAVPVEPDQSVAAAAWRAGIRAWPAAGAQVVSRGLFCGIGACYRCLASVDDRPDERTCLAPAVAGAIVRGGRARLASPAGAPPRGPAPARSWSRYDVAVVGAGPAGLAAAATAALGGARVVLLDSATRLGGQFWRHRHAAGPADPAGTESATPRAAATGTGARDWGLFHGLRSIVEERVDHIGGASVWFVEPGFVLHTSAGRIEATHLVLATGAYDRALPFPGWDLPGVVTPGAAQALLKGSGVTVGREVVVAGAGPFLLPVAAGLAQAGARVVCVVEAGDPRRYLRGAGGAAFGKLGEVAGYATVLARHRIPYRTGRAVVAAHGDAETGVRAVEIARLDPSGQIAGSPRRVDCDAVAVGYGFTANLDLALSLGCATRLCADGGLAVVVSTDGHTSITGVYAAGEVTGVGGAALAVVEGKLAGCAAAQAAGASPALSPRELGALRRRRDRLVAFADVMHAAHPVPAGWPAWLASDTIVCRCEQVSYARVRHAVADLGASDARTVKLLSRPGMGWCQARVCGYPVAQLTARLCGRGVTREDMATFVRRPLAAPVTLGELAQLA